MADVIIFGKSDLAELAKFYLDNDSEHTVVGFTVDQEYQKEDYYKGLPLFPFEEVFQMVRPGEVKFFIPMTQTFAGKIREEKYLKVKEMGFDCISYISSKATVWQKENIGENCFIFEDNTIQPFTKVGNNVVMWSGNHIGHHSEVKDHVFFTSHVVMSGHVTVEPYSFFGVNSTIRDGVTIAEGTCVGMGATITKDTEPYGVYSIPGTKKREVNLFESMKDRAKEYRNNYIDKENREPEFIQLTKKEAKILYEHLKYKEIDRAIDPNKNTLYGMRIIT